MATFKENFYNNIMPKIYGIGAAVVILGAMFKILDWQGANIMIGVGLTTEAIIFFLSAFEPAHKEIIGKKFIQVKVQAILLKILLPSSLIKCLRKQTLAQS